MVLYALGTVASLLQIPVSGGRAQMGALFGVAIIWYLLCHCEIYFQKEFYTTSR